MNLGSEIPFLSSVPDPYQGRRKENRARKIAFNVRDAPTMLRHTIVKSSLPEYVTSLESQHKPDRHELFFWPVTFSVKTRWDNDFPLFQFISTQRMRINFLPRYFPSSWPSQPWL